MRYPEFLVVGAMKCGTTSLYFDLRTSPWIFLPEEKEPNSLTRDSVLERSGREAYARLFAPAKAEQICGEASTDYTKLPDFTGAASRAREVIGHELKILYLVREPVARVLSHHYHEVTAGTMARDIDVATRSEPRLLSYTQYATQIRPWLDAFGEDQIRIIPFEEYVQDRKRTVASISRFLGVEPRTEGIDLGRVHNKGEDARIPRGLVRRLSRNRAYRFLIRSWVSRPIRTRIRNLVTPAAPPRPRPPSVATVDYILERLRPDLEELQQLMGLDRPLWDLEEVRRKHAERAPGG